MQRLVWMMMAGVMICVSAAARGPDEPGKAYRNRSWVEDRMELLMEGLALDPGQAERIRILLQEEHEQALRDRKELGREIASFRQRRPPGHGGTGFPGGFGRSGAGPGHEPGSDGRGFGPVNPELVARARMRYQRGDDRLKEELTAEQQRDFPAVCPPREEYPDGMIMLVEKLDLNDTQAEVIRPLFQEMQRKMAALRSMSGERSSRIQAVDRAMSAYREQVEAELNREQKKIFRAMQPRGPMDSGGHRRGPGRGFR